jgi:ArsR family transcriptional regulator
VDDLVAVFKALSDETRLRTLRLLGDEELCVCDIVAALDMVQPKVSFHLRILKNAGLIKDRKQGKWIHYRIDGNNIFNRFLILSVLEKISDESVKEDRRRLDKFKKTGMRTAITDPAAWWP